jgi:parallel beta-helix repeat protein
VTLAALIGVVLLCLMLTLPQARAFERLDRSGAEYWKPDKDVKCGDILEGGNYRLAGDVVCESGGDPAVTLKGKTRLDLNGFAVLCNGTGRNGIVLEGSGAKVLNGVVSECKDGIVVTGEYNSIINVAMQGSTRRGINIDGGKGNLVFMCSAENNEREGFKIDTGDDNFLYKCLAQKNGRTGFKIEKGADNLLIKCLAENNGQQGIKIEEGNFNKIYFNEVHANCRDGIEIEEGSENVVINNLVESNGNREVCNSFAEDYRPWFYAGIDVTPQSGENEIKYNRACGNHGCVPCYDDVGEPTCKARERDFWDENVDPEGNPASTNHWKNNRIVCENVEPEYSPKPD